MIPRSRFLRKQEAAFVLLAPASVNKSNMHNAVTDFLRTSHACLLLVHPEVRTLGDEANELLSVYEWPRRLLTSRCMKVD